MESFMKSMQVFGPLQASDRVFEQSVPIYDIIINNSYDELSLLFSSLKLSGRKVLILTDQHIAPHYLASVKKEAEKYASYVDSLVIEAGEIQKNLDTIQMFYQELINKHFERKDWLFALGGGVIGDMAGFTAATYLRGIRFIQLPTSLLAMVDSSIGGKTGVDWKAYKNMIGAFHQPQAVYINIGTLSTLPEREFHSGFGEIIKHGLIQDASYFAWLLDHADAILAKDPCTLMQTIEISCQIKKKIVEQDPTEKKERALLNFGHTIGHSIEKLMNFSLLHGECVALGIVCASYISLKKQLLSEKQWERILALLNRYHLLDTLTEVRKTLDADDILRVSKLDKKMQDGKIRFVLLSGIGSAIISESVTDQEMLGGIHYLLEGMIDGRKN